MPFAMITPKVLTEHVLFPDRTVHFNFFVRLIHDLYDHPPNHPPPLLPNDPDRPDLTPVTCPPEDILTLVLPKPLGRARPTPLAPPTRVPLKTVGRLTARYAGGEKLAGVVGRE